MVGSIQQCTSSRNTLKKRNALQGATERIQPQNPQTSNPSAIAVTRGPQETFPRTTQEAIKYLLDNGYAKKRVKLLSF
jgi:hypothetical protein